MLANMDLCMYVCMYVLRMYHVCMYVLVFILQKWSNFSKNKIKFYLLVHFKTKLLKSWDLIFLNL